MKCDNCSEEWIISEVGGRQIKYCPFCGVEIKDNVPTGFADLSDCIKYLRRKYTHTIFFEPKKLLSYVSDYMPELTVEKRILKVALEAGVYRYLLDDLGKIKSLNIEKAKYILINDYGLSDKWACEAVNWIVNSFSENNINSTEANERKNYGDYTQEKSDKIFGRDNKGKYTYLGVTDARGIPNGKGELTYESGDKYIGTFSNGQLVGRGKFISSHGYTFEGIFEKGKQVECDGVLVEKSGDKYEGHFRRGLRKHGTMIVTKRGYQKSLRQTYDNGHYISHW